MALSVLVCAGLAVVALESLSLLRPFRFLGIAKRSGFVVLAEDPGRELVLGTLLVRPRGARVSVPDDPAETGRRFAVYWRLVHPGSALIRAMWLRAIAERAESGN